VHVIDDRPFGTLQIVMTQTKRFTFTLVVTYRTSQEAPVKMSRNIWFWLMLVKLIQLNPDQCSQAGLVLCDFNPRQEARVN